MAKETITFNATASYDLDGSIASYEWDFGDGVTTNTADPVITHIYTTPTSTGFDVTLKVTDNDGLISDPASVSIKEIRKTHDIAITDVILSSDVVVIGENLTISVTAKNEGDDLGGPLGGPSTFYVLAFYNGTQFGATQSVIDLAAGAEEVLTFIWSTTSVDPGTYVIKAIAETTKRELNATNNELTGGTVTLRAFPRTITELKTKIQEFGLEDEIDNRGIVKSLIVKLNTAQKSVDKGKTDKAERILEKAFIQQVQNLSGIHITPEAADILIESAEYIISHLYPPFYS
jgi:hypothetical protein